MFTNIVVSVGHFVILPTFLMVEIERNPAILDVWINFNYVLFRLKIIFFIKINGYTKIRRTYFEN